MFERPPNGFFVRDLILFNHLRRGGYVSKGFVFEAPDLTNSQVADLNDFQDQLCLLLASLHENQRLQVQYFCDSDYKGELLRYQQETEKFSNVWTKRARNERLARYWQAMSDRKLRRQRVIFYISRSLENVPKSFQSDAARRDYYNTLLDQLETEFDHVHRLLLEINFPTPVAAFVLNAVTFPANNESFPAGVVSLPTPVDGLVLGIVTFPADAGDCPMSIVNGPASIANLPAGIDCLVLTTESLPASLETSKMGVFRPFCSS